MEEGADSVKLYDQNNTLSERHIKADKNADEKVPDQMWLKCPYCHQLLFAKQLLNMLFVLAAIMDYEYLLVIDFHG